MKTLLIILALTLAVIGAASKFTSHPELPPPAGIEPMGGGRLGEGKLER